MIISINNNKIIIINIRRLKRIILCVQHIELVVNHVLWERCFEPGVYQ